MTRPPSEVLASLGQPRLLVVGDLVIDRYLTGPVDRISPEAPIPILRVASEEERLGCAGSVAWIVGVLGATVELVGVVGEDEAGPRLAALAREAGIDLHAFTEPGRPTSLKTRCMAHSHTTHQQVLRVDRESKEPLDDATADAMIEHLASALDRADAVLLSDYGKGCLTDRVLRTTLDGARARGLPIVVDPKGREFGKYHGATSITPNRGEAFGATGVRVRTLADAEAAATRLVEDLGLEFALVTLDRDGMYLKQAGQSGDHLPTTPREVFDVTGAGDMVLGALTTALASGATPLEAASLANVAAGLAVEHVGVAAVTRGEIAARLLASGASASKHVDAVDIEATAERHRAAKRRVVFTNGCFDILHAGHVRFLEAAKAHGDVLVVGLNADQSVRRIKGEERPINPADDRIAVLAGLSVVDHVVVFDEDTPLELIRRVQPDVLVKGMDWKDKGVVGQDVVEARGGRVVLVDLLEGRSTTRVVNRIRGD